MPTRRLLLSAVIPFAIGVVVAVACYIAAGVSLGLFFGPLLISTFLAPQLAMAEERKAGVLLSCIALSLGVWLVWLASANLNAVDACRSGLVLYSYFFALAGGASFLSRLGLGKVFPVVVMVLLGVLWLTWPVWLCPWLEGPRAQSAVNALTIAHPLMAMNTIFFARFNFWDRFPLAYQQLTILNQDILYTLPTTIFWMVLLHLGIGTAGFIPRLQIRGRASSRRQQIVSSP